MVRLYLGVASQEPEGNIERDHFDAGRRFPYRHVSIFLLLAPKVAASQYVDPSFHDPVARLHARRSYPSLSPQEEQKVCRKSKPVLKLLVCKLRPIGSKSAFSISG